MLTLKPHSIDWSVAGANIPAVTFIAQAGLATRELAHMLDSLVRVSRRVGGATDLLATDMRPVPKHSKETTQIPVAAGPEGKAPAARRLPFTKPIWNGNNGSSRTVLEKCGQRHQRQYERDFAEPKRTDRQPLA